MNPNEYYYNENQEPEEEQEREIIISENHKRRKFGKGLTKLSLYSLLFSMITFGLMILCLFFLLFTSSSGMIKAAQVFHFIASGTAVASLALFAVDRLTQKTLAFDAVLLCSVLAVLVVFGF